MQEVDELTAAAAPSEAAPSNEGQSREADPCFDPEPSTAGGWRGRIEAVGEGETSSWPHGARAGQMLGPKLLESLLGTY